MRITPYESSELEVWRKSTKDRSTGALEWKQNRHQTFVVQKVYKEVVSDNNEKNIEHD